MQVPTSQITCKSPGQFGRSESVRITLDKMKGPKYEKIYKWQAL